MLLEKDWISGMLWKQTEIYRQIKASTTLADMREDWPNVLDTDFSLAFDCLTAAESAWVFLHPEVVVANG